MSYRSSGSRNPRPGMPPGALSPYTSSSRRHADADTNSEFSSARHGPTDSVSNRTGVRSVAAEEAFVDEPAPTHGREHGREHRNGLDETSQRSHGGSTLASHHPRRPRNPPHRESAHQYPHMDNEPYTSRYPSSSHPTSHLPPSFPSSSSRHHPQRPGTDYTQMMISDTHRWDHEPGSYEEEPIEHIAGGRIVTIRGTTLWVKDDDDDDTSESSSEEGGGERSLREERRFESSVMGAGYCWNLLQHPVFRC